MYGVGDGGWEGGGQGACPNVRDNIPAGLVRLINTFTDASCSLGNWQVAKSISNGRHLVSS